MITAIIQARMGSTRLPNKVLLPLGGKTVIEHVVERAMRTKSIGRVVLATSDSPSDDPIVELCKKTGIDYFRGSLDDVLDRYYHAAKHAGAKHICRLTGDCPLIEPAIINRVAKKYLSGGWDYVSTGRIETTFPDGMDTEIFSFAALDSARREARLPSEREHVTPYIWKNTKKFRVCHIKNDKDLSHIRLTIDEPRDYEFLKIIFENVETLTLGNVLLFLKKHPEIQNINASIIRDEGYIKSLHEDNKHTT
jgi:spore coat polysaccharide biosynthesis protein SpsF